MCGSWSTQYSGSNRSKAYSGKANGVDYGYRVRACNAVGCSPWSGYESVMVQAGGWLAAPASSTAVSTDGGTIKQGGQP